MQPSAVIITIDGPAGVGKSTVAHGLARRLGLDYLDTGAMYRAAALVAIEQGIDPHDGRALADAVTEAGLLFDFAACPPRMMLGSRDVSARIREADVSALVSAVAASGELRAALVAQQRRIGADHPRLVTEGRDQGSVVFPEAPLKLYLSADVGVRARRRADQIRAAGRAADEEQVAREIHARDQRDASRDEGPLIRPADAVEIDTSDRAAEEIVDELEALSRRRFPEAAFT